MRAGTVIVAALLVLAAARAAAVVAALLLAAAVATALVVRPRETLGLLALGVAAGLVERQPLACLGAAAVAAAGALRRR